MYRRTDGESDDDAVYGSDDASLFVSNDGASDASESSSDDFSDEDEWWFDTQRKHRLLLGQFSFLLQLQLGFYYYWNGDGSYADKRLVFKYSGNSILISMSAEKLESKYNIQNEVHTLLPYILAAV